MVCKCKLFEMVQQRTIINDYLEEVGEADPENEIADWDCSSSRMPSRIESRVIELSGIILVWFAVGVWKIDKSNLFIYFKLTFSEV